MRSVIWAAFAALVFSGCTSIFDGTPPPSRAPVGPIFLQFDGNTFCENETRVCSEWYPGEDGKPIPGKPCILHMRLPDWTHGLEHEIEHCVLGEFHPHLH